MNGIEPKAFEFAVGKIEDGFVFEKFVQGFLSRVLGYEFVPVGGLKDRGIDGFEHSFARNGFSRTIYQISIEQDCKGKLEGSLKKLLDNSVNFEVLYFVTSRNFPEKDKEVDRLFAKYKRPVHIYDVGWLAAHANDSLATVQTFRTFVESFLHEFSKPGKSYVVGDLVADPRLFVFLRQQWDADRTNLELDTILADSLILYSLEGTDPDKRIFKTEGQVRASIAQLIKFEPKLISDLIGKRLAAMSAKPNRINFHRKENAYCLPYETRTEIENRNLKDAELYDAFRQRTEERLRRHLNGASVRVTDCAALVERVVNQIFYQQGLEFTNFVIHGENSEAFEKRLPDVVASVVDSASVVLKNREAVKVALLMAIRDVVYNGSAEEKTFLKRLSCTYMMLFLLQCDPKLATFFSSMAGRLRIYVCTSIIIPALSEFYLEPYNRRYWNLLKGAYNAGVQLVINRDILHELVSHFRMVVRHYKDQYEPAENVYLSNDLLSLYVDEILIRAYFYAKAQRRVRNFEEFLDNFLSPSLEHAAEDLTEWLRHEFGIRFMTNDSLHVKLDKKEEETLYQALKTKKSNQAKARTDARVLLTVHTLRQMNNENDRSGVFGYQTWWLSMDTSTQKAVASVFKDRYKMGVYIRPDFLYNYVSLSPSRSEVDAAYTELFPSLLGVNVSFHMPEDALEFIRHEIAEHAGKNTARLNGVLRELGEKLKVDPSVRTRNYIKSYFDEHLREGSPTCQMSKGMRPSN